jgi:hypothetical protein
MSVRRALLLGLAVLAPVLGRGAVQAQTEAPGAVHAAPASGLQVFLMTMGPGAQVHERFGHNAIWIRDTMAGTDLVYNYGMFDFEAPGFLWNFVKARGMYWLEAVSLENTLRVYEFFQRRVDVQELALNTAQKGQLAYLLAQNALPENREYRYDYFLDNCSTRVRDILDVVLGGALRAGSEGRAAEGTLRWHTQRSVSNDPGLYLGILAGLGSRVDQPIDQWTEMFLPAKVQERVRELRVLDDRGLEVPLVLRESTLLDINVHRVEPRQPDWSLQLFGIGIVIGLVMVTGTVRGPAGIAGRVLAGTWGLLATVGGAVLLFLWLFTNHEMSAWNINVLLFSPVGIALLVLLVGRKPSGWLHTTGYCYVGMVLLGALLGGTRLAQDSRELVALMCIPSLVAAWVALAVNRRRVAAPLPPT